MDWDISAFNYKHSLLIFSSFLHCRGGGQHLCICGSLQQEIETERKQHNSAPAHINPLELWFIIVPVHMYCLCCVWENVTRTLRKAKLWPLEPWHSSLTWVYFSHSSKFNIIIPLVKQQFVITHWYIVLQDKKNWQVIDRPACLVFTKI